MPLKSSFWLEIWEVWRVLGGSDEDEKESSRRSQDLEEELSGERRGEGGRTEPQS